MNTTPTARRLAASAVLLVALVLGACSDDDGGEAAPAAPAEADAEAAGGTEVAIEDFLFKPADLQVKAGTTVTFTNKDDFAHTATAKDKSFDSGNVDKDGSFEHTFAEAGTYDYLCSIHNSMTGTITVS
jgi:plastocyanin